MPSDRNIQRVEDLARRLARSRIIIATGFTGLSVAVLNDLRLRLRARGSEYKVVKNTLAAIAAQRAGKGRVRDLLEGPTGLVLGYEDPAEPARVLEEFIRTTRAPLAVRGAVLDGQVLTAQEVIALATLPPKPDLVAQAVGYLKGSLARLLSALLSPAQGMATVLTGPVGGLARVLQRSVEARGSGG